MTKEEEEFVRQVEANRGIPWQAIIWYVLIFTVIPGLLAAIFK